MAALYQAHKRLIEFVVRRSGIADRDVDDVVHDTFIQIGVALGRFDPTRGEGLRSWLGTIARRTAKDYLALHRTAEIPIGFDAEGALVNDATPEARLLDEEPRALVRHLIDQGDEVLSRVIYGEQTWEEIAAELGIPRSTVQARVRRAYAGLWARLRRRRAAARFTPPR